jgi:hypothetical protein
VVVPCGTCMRAWIHCRAWLAYILMFDTSRVSVCALIDAGLGVCPQPMAFLETRRRGTLCPNSGSCWPHYMPSRQVRIGRWSASFGSARVYACERVVQLYGYACEMAVQGFDHVHVKPSGHALIDWLLPDAAAIARSLDMGLGVRQRRLDSGRRLKAGGVIGGCRTVSQGEVTYVLPGFSHLLAARRF